MKKPNYATAKVCFFILVFLVNHLAVFGQRPPTSGPNPDDPINLTPYIIGGSALALGAGSYLYIKSRGPKIPVTENLEDFLWRQNIVPTPDALNLMYELNPSLRNKEVMRVKKKLVAPEFPEIPEEIRKLTAYVPPTTYVMPDNLMDLVEAFKSNLNIFRGISMKTSDPNAPLDAFNEILKNLEATITAPERYTEARSSVKDLLLTDLIIVINQTVANAIETKELSGDKLILLHAIAEDLENLVFPNVSFQPMEVGENKYGDHLADWRLFLAFEDKNPHAIANWNNPPDVQRDVNPRDINPAAPQNADEKWFAFAVYKYNAEGELITQGREVEGRYQISYVLPALKDIPNRYHTIIGNATYGVAQLPLGKYFIKVTEEVKEEGEEGRIEEVRIQNPIIDFTEQFYNPLKELHKGLPKVLIHLSK